MSDGPFYSRTITVSDQEREGVKKNYEDCGWKIHSEDATTVTVWLMKKEDDLCGLFDGK
jgi:hypothetical protein